MVRRGIRVGALCALALFCAVVPAAAQSKSAEAEQLFRDGKRLMGEGKFAEACVAFASSQELDPTVSTLVNLADCREKNGQLASAWGAFLEVERKTRGDAKKAGLHKIAKDRAAKLEPRLSYLTVSVPAESQVEGLALTRNGETLAPGSWNRAIPVDGGAYTITGQAPGHEAWSTTIEVPSEAGRVSVDVPRFKVVEELMAPAEPPGPDEGGADPEANGPVDAPSRFTGRRKIALGVAGAGVIALGAGIVLGVQAKGFEDDAYAACPANPCGGTADEASDLLDRAQQRALFADVAFGVALAAAAGAAVLWFTGGPDPETGGTTLVPAVTPNSASLALTGRF